MQSDQIAHLRSLLQRGDQEFWKLLAQSTDEASSFERLFALLTLRKRAVARQLPRPDEATNFIRLALVGGYSLYPFHELLDHLCAMSGLPCELHLGAYDNYVSEIMDETSELHHFAPQVVVVMPAERRCRYTGALTDSRQAQQAEAGRVVESLLELAARARDRSPVEVIMTNFMLPARHDLGAYRSRTMGSDWTFRQWVNLELGLRAPPFLHICDLAFLAHRLGGLAARDDRAWFESKQLGSPALLVAAARETARLLVSLRAAPKKVLALDLDNSLWGGVVADDGLEGIEIGDTSPRGEAFKAFQRYIVSLKQRGVLLAVCSKNDYARAVEPFTKHPEMVLKLEDFVSFKANWEPKADNIRQIAADLNLGLDSIVFVDDNPAEIEIVRQFLPEVTTISLGPDPSEYVAQLQDCRLFEPVQITADDAQRTAQYQSESQRREQLASITDMDAYLASLAMEAEIKEFTTLDAPRLAQLINKSNQFNLTTRRRSEAEVQALLSDPAFVCISVRLRDRFGDYGLISIVIAEQVGDVLKIDTWLMSCRVLKRQVEDEVLNELMRLATRRNCSRLEGVYLPTAKNEMVRDFYLRMGFTLQDESEQARIFDLTIGGFSVLPTKIKIIRRAYEPS